MVINEAIVKRERRLEENDDDGMKHIKNKIKKRVEQEIAVVGNKYQNESETRTSASVLKKISHP